jgi:hypothetical protein
MPNTVFVPTGYTVTITAPEINPGTYRRVAEPGATKYPLYELDAGGSVTLGPFNTARNYEMFCNSGEFTYTLTEKRASIPSPFNLEDVKVTVSAEEINHLTGVKGNIQDQIDAITAAIEAMNS